MKMNIMEDEEGGGHHHGRRDIGGGFSSAPSLVSISPIPFSPQSTSSRLRRLSTHFSPTRPVALARRLAWVSLEGRLVNAEEASSSASIGGGLTKDQMVAWELFTPIQRFLIVAVIGVAAAESKKNFLISHLQKSVHLRDQVLYSMQQKLDDLCEQANSFKNQAGTFSNNLTDKNNVELATNETFGCDKIKFLDCGCWHCDLHQHFLAPSLSNSAAKLSKGDEVAHYKMPLNINEGQQEERRMSDLSDWASSVTSAADIQMNTFAIDQDILNLQRESEEKDATIKELKTILQSSNVAGSKRIAELEDIVRRKNMIITKLKKDMVVLEQKLVHITRVRRPSSSLPSPDSWQFPLMVDNIVYDMDNSTSPSSSDSDTSPVNRPQPPVCEIQETPVQSNGPVSATIQKSGTAKLSRSLVGLNESDISSSPMEETSTSSSSNKFSFLRPRKVSAGGDFKKMRKQTPITSKDAAPKKRWV